MKKQWFLVVMIFLLVPWLLAGCGIAQDVYDAVVAERDSLIAQLQSVQSELDTAKSKLELAQNELDAKLSEFESVQKELDTAKAKLDSVQSEFDTTKSALQSVQAQFDSAKAELENVKDELTEIKEVYPPRDFSSVKELRDWLISNDVSERPASTDAENLYSKALEIQEDALNDGYIVSAWIDYYPDEELFYVLCQTVVQGDVWMWNPEDDELANFSDMSGLLKLR